VSSVINPRLFDFLYCFDIIVDMANHKRQFVHYDPEADVVFVYNRRGREEEFVEVSPNVSLELDKKGAVIGVEILNASKVLRPFLQSLRKRRLMHAK
jgi:uncharacterized protein YuzE